MPPDSCTRIGRLDVLVPATTGDLTVEIELRAGAAAARPAIDVGPRRIELPVRCRTAIAIA